MLQIYVKYDVEAMFYCVICLFTTGLMQLVQALDGKTSDLYPI